MKRCLLLLMLVLPPVAPAQVDPAPAAQFVRQYAGHLVDLDAMNHLFWQVFRYRIVQLDQALFMEHHDGGSGKQFGGTSNIKGSCFSHGHLANLVCDAGRATPGEGAISFGDA